MELDPQSLFWATVYSCTYWLSLRPRNSTLFPQFGLIYEGAIGQPRWTTSLCNPLDKTNPQTPENDWVPPARPRPHSSVT